MDPDDARRTTITFYGMSGHMFRPLRVILASCRLRPAGYGLRSGRGAAAAPPGRSHSSIPAHSTDMTTAPHAEGSVTAAEAPDPGVHPLRRLLLAVVVVGALGLIAELFLLEHTESVYQWLPLIALFLTAPLAVVLALRPTRPLLRVFQALMIVAVVIGGLGVYLHFQGNTEFELEMDPALRGFDLVWSALGGATPSLAPGAMVQLALVGLASLYRHPLLRRPA